MQIIRQELAKRRDQAAASNNHGSVPHEEAEGKASGGLRPSPAVLFGPCEMTRQGCLSYHGASRILLHLRVLHPGTGISAPSLQMSRRPALAAWRPSPWMRRALARARRPRPAACHATLPTRAPSGGRCGRWSPWASAWPSVSGGAWAACVCGAVGCLQAQQCGSAIPCSANLQRSPGARIIRRSLLVKGARACAVRLHLP